MKNSSIVITFAILLLLFISSCSHTAKENPDKTAGSQTDLSSEFLGQESSPDQQTIPIKKRHTFKEISEVITDSTANSWLDYKSNSLWLHFMNEGILDVEYSHECWLSYPYKIENNQIIVYWDNQIDSKYNFDIVKAIHEIDKKYIGKPFMTLELVNDTTLQANYLLKHIAQKINQSSIEKRTFFPDHFTMSQHF